MADGQGQADVVPSPPGLQGDVVVLAVEIGDGRLDAVRLQVRPPPGVGHCAAPVGVEVQGVVVERLGQELVVDVEVLEVGDVVLVLDDNARPPAEGHSEVGVEGGAAAECVQLGFLGGHG